MFRAQSDKVQNQQLKVQELVIRTADTHLYVVDGSDVVVQIGQEISAIVQCLFQDNSAATIAPKPAASLSIVDQDSPYGAGGDAKAIRVASVTLDTNDLLVVKYVTAG